MSFADNFNGDKKVETFKVKEDDSDMMDALKYLGMDPADINLSFFMQKGKGKNALSDLLSKLKGMSKVDATAYLNKIGLMKGKGKKVQKKTLKRRTKKGVKKAKSSSKRRMRKTKYTSKRNRK